MSINFEKGRSIAINDLMIKQMVSYVKTTTKAYNYWYFVMATCFGLSLDHPLDNVLNPYHTNVENRVSS